MHGSFFNLNKVKYKIVTFTHFHAIFHFFVIVDYIMCGEDSWLHKGSILWYSQKWQWAFKNVYFDKYRVYIAKPKERCATTRVKIRVFTWVSLRANENVPNILKPPSGIQCNLYPAPAKIHYKKHKIRKTETKNLVVVIWNVYTNECSSLTKSAYTSTKLVSKTTQMWHCASIDLSEFLV